MSWCWLFSRGLSFSLHEPLTKASWMSSWRMAYLRATNSRCQDRSCNAILWHNQRNCILSCLLYSVSHTGLTDLVWECIHKGSYTRKHAIAGHLRGWLHHCHHTVSSKCVSPVWTFHLNPADWSTYPPTCLTGISTYHIENSISCLH